MPLRAEVLDALVAAGATAEQVAAAVKADMEAERLADEGRRAAKRANNAERQRRFKVRHKENGSPPGGGGGNGSNALPHGGNAGNAENPPPPPSPEPPTPAPTRPPAQRAHAYTHESEVPENWEPRSEVFDQAVQTILFRDKLPVPDCREFARHEVMRFRFHSRSHGLRYADLDAGFLNFLTKPNRPRERQQSPLTVVNGAKTHAHASKPSVTDVLRARIAAREA